MSRDNTASRVHCFILIPVLLILFASAALSDTRPTAEITFTVNGIAEISGTLMIAVFATEESFEARSNPVARTRLPVRAHSMKWTVELGVPGGYAFIAWQDMNGNGEIDLNALGVPQEPYGFSNNASRPFGPPGFTEARISLDRDDLAHEIELR